MILPKKKIEIIVVTNIISFIHFHLKNRSIMTVVNSSFYSISTLSNTNGSFPDEIEWKMVFSG